MINLIKDRVFLYLLLSSILVILLEVLNILGFQIPFPYSPIIFGAFILITAHKVLYNGLKAILKLSFSSINLLMLIACVSAFYLEQYSEAAVVAVLYVLGEKLEDIGIESSKSALDKLINKIPKKAYLKNEDKFELLSEIKIGSVVSVKPGEIIPLDGKIINGNTNIDESTITGESIPKSKQLGDIVYAGTININGYFEFETTKLLSDTTFSKIVHITFESSLNKSKTQSFIQKFSKIYTPSIIILSLLVFFVPVLFLNKNVNFCLLQAITLLVIACPCALVISSPIAIYSAIGNASSKGAIIKGGKYLELLSKIKAICLDKTRTITFGNPIVSDIRTYNNTNKEELLACTAGVEKFSEHPLANAIVKASIEEGVVPHKTTNFESVAGKGAKAVCLVCKNEKIFIGKIDYLREKNLISNDIEDEVERLSNEGKTNIIVSFNNKIGGIISLTDEIKPDSISAIKKINSLKIDTFMLTGDSVNSANYIAKKVGINNVHGNLLPEDKAYIIDELIKKYKYVAMVGDGVNDAPALVKSTVGIAMGANGSDTAIETANIALMNDNLLLIPFLVQLSKKTLKVIKINTISAILVKLIFVILSLLGYGNLIFAIIADVGLTLIVIILSLRLLKFE